MLAFNTEVTSIILLGKENNDNADNAFNTRRLENTLDQQNVMQC